MLSYEEDHKFFEEVIGYYDTKRLFRMAISAQEPVHILPVGPPASAKNCFYDKPDEIAMLIFY
jgi:hypothetical protein